MPLTCEEARTKLQDPSTTELDLSALTLTLAQLESLANAFTSHPALHTIRLWNNQFDVQVTLRLFELFEAMPHLRHLDIAAWPTKSEIIKVLSDFLASNPPLHSLKLGHMKMRYENSFFNEEHSWETRLVHSSETLTDALKKNTRLTELYFYQNTFEQNDIKLFCHTLSTHPSITAFTLKDALLHDTGGNQPELTREMANQELILGGSPFAELLASNSRLQKLALVNCHLSTLSVCAIAQALIQNTQLKELDLSDNALGTQGLESFFYGIRKNHTLNALRLDSNQLGDAGVALLVSALKKTKKHTIEEIGLNANGITDIGLKQIVRLLNTSHYIKILWLSNNNFTLASIEKLAAVLQRNSPLQHLDLTECQLGLECFIPLAKAMKNNTIVTLLDLYAPNSAIDCVFSDIKKLTGQAPVSSDNGATKESFRNFFKSQYIQFKDKLADPREWLLNAIKKALPNTSEETLNQTVQFIIDDDYFNKMVKAHNTINNQIERNRLRTAQHIPCSLRSVSPTKVFNLENMKEEVKIAIEDYIATHNPEVNPQLETAYAGHHSGLSGRRLAAQTHTPKSACAAPSFWSIFKPEWHSQYGIDRANSLQTHLNHQTSLLFALNVLLVFFQQKKNGNWHEESLKSILLIHLIRTFGYADCDITMDNDSAVNYVHALRKIADPTSGLSDIHYKKMLEEKPRFLV